MPSNLSTEQIERWRIRDEERQADTAHIQRHQERDEKRRQAQTEMLALLQKFLDGHVSLPAFRTTFDRHTRTKWNQFGFKGLSGAMFLNTLVKHIPDQEEATQRLRQVLPLPAASTAGRSQMRSFYDYLLSLEKKGQITRRQVQAARVPFFVSGWWHLQQPDAWPVFYTSGRQALEQDGLFQSSSDPIADYFAFRETFLALAQALGLAPWDLEHLLGWMAKGNRADVTPSPESITAIVEAEETSLIRDDEEGQPGEYLNHAHIQWLLARIGRKLGCRVWIAANDHNRAWQSQRLGDLSMAQLPTLGLDRETQRIISLIDVIWIQGDRRVAAAFEVEHTTSIYSGLLRLSDLVAVAPNLSFPLYIVTPDARLDKVRRELSRPTFQALSLHEICGFFSFEKLGQAADGIMSWANDPGAINRLAEKVESVTIT